MDAKLRWGSLGLEDLDNGLVRKWQEESGWEARKHSLNKSTTICMGHSLTFVHGPKVEIVDGMISMWIEKKRGATRSVLYLDEQLTIINSQPNAHVDIKQLIDT